MKVAGSENGPQGLYIESESKTYLEVDARYYQAFLERDAQVYANLEEIARCESGFNETVKNKTSSATGYLQIIKGTWEGFGCTGDIKKREDNLKCGYKIVTQSGYHHWNESRACWGSHVVI